MSTTAQPVYTTSTSGEKGTIAHFGVIQHGRFGRTVVYVTEPVHLASASNGTDNNETLFHDHPFCGIMAVSGEADERTLEIVYRLSYYAVHTYHRYIGIRISASDNPDYLSKIVFYMPPDGDVKEACAEIADVLYDTVASVEVTLLYSENVSLTETRDRRDFNALDY